MPNAFEPAEPIDAVVIGAGFYGCVIALHLVEQLGLRNVQLIERGSALLGRASLNNQARVHNGYHYPRSFTTAYRSRLNLPKFVQDWPGTVTRDFKNVYAIARRNSKVTARQFVRFCNSIGARVEPADLPTQQLFSSRLIEDVFVTEEFVFDSSKLAVLIKEELVRSGIKLSLQTTAMAITPQRAGGLEVVVQTAGDRQESLRSRYVFNCTYSGLNQLGGFFAGTQTRLKHEIAEMGLLSLPPALSSLGITVMDGPFFSMMPFPARGLHTLSHVRYTPHASWADDSAIDPYQKLAEYEKNSRVDRMMRDATRYIPALTDAKVVDSIFEIKTILTKNEGDDGRPILFEAHTQLPGFYSVLGGKIDNVYDVLEKLESENIS